MNAGLRFLTTLGSSCPYTIAGKKILQVLRGRPAEGAARVTDREMNLWGRVRTGRNIALIGLFCPIFWVSLFTGVRGDQLYFNLVHSGVVVLIGVAVMGVNLRLIRRVRDETAFKRKRSRRETAHPVPARAVESRQRCGRIRPAEGRMVAGSATTPCGSEVPANPGR